MIGYENTGERPFPPARPITSSFGAILGGFAIIIGSSLLTALAGDGVRAALKVKDTRKR